MFPKIMLTLSLSLLTFSSATGGAHHEGMRLVVADAKLHTLSVWDLESGKILSSFSTPGKITYVNASPSGRFALAAHRDANRVTVLHSGLSLIDHGDHADLVESAPYVLSTINTGKQPTHYFAHDEDIAFFNDGQGTVSVFKEAMLPISMDFKEIKVAQPDHGAPVILGNDLLNGYLRLNRVDVFDLESGTLKQTLEGCPALHGETIWNGAVYFGCTDGVLKLKKVFNQWTSSKVKNPAGTAEKVRVGTVVAHDKAGVAYGNFGQGLAQISKNASELKPIALPARPLKFSFDSEGKNLVVLTADGNLHLLEGSSGKVLKSLKVTEPGKVGVEGAVNPTFTLSKEAAYVLNPEKGQVLEVYLKNLTLERTLNVGGTPSSVAVLALEGGVKH